MNGNTKAPQRQWLHRKRQTIYVEVGRAELQASSDVVEGAILVIYRDRYGKLWAREEGEFEDGRFVEARSGGADEPTESRT